MLFKSILKILLPINSFISRAAVESLLTDHSVAKSPYIKFSTHICRRPSLLRAVSGAHMHF